MGAHLAFFVEYITFVLLAREKLKSAAAKDLAARIKAMEEQAPGLRSAGFYLRLKDCDTLVMLAPIKATERSEMNDLTPEQRGHFIAQLQPALCTAYHTALGWCKRLKVTGLRPEFVTQRQLLRMSARSDSALGFRTVKQSLPASMMDEGGSSSEDEDGGATPTPEDEDGAAPEDAAIPAGAD
jgi:hypothetical protein